MRIAKWVEALASEDTYKGLTESLVENSVNNWVDSTGDITEP